MNITFMIGNGFDILVGLKTRYIDFYNYMKKDSVNDKNNKNGILVNIDKNIELWSDLELGLGNYTHTIEEDEIRLEKFYKDKFEIDLKLREYLKREQDRVNWQDKINGMAFRSEFINHIAGFYNFFKPSDKDEILETIAKRPLKYYLISFNYTNIIKEAININKSIDVETLYLHGTLNDENSILGVNDLEQIKNKYFNNRTEMLLSMCKLEMNKFLGEYRINKAEDILNSSEIVCIFGMSIGETDKYWWEKLIDSLEKGIIKIIIVFHYSSKLYTSNLVELWREQNRVKERILKYSSADNKDKLKDRIKVLCNSDMFKLRLKLEEESDFEIKINEEVAVAQ